MKKCKGKYVFQQQIHNGNDAYKCDVCKDIIVVKVLPNKRCRR